MRSARWLVAGGGVHYSLAESELADFALRHGIPVVETVAGKTSLVADHPRYAGPVGVTGAAEPNEACAAADVVLAVGTRLNDFVTGSWTLFDEDARIVALNTARFDATKHLATPVVGDARESLVELSALLGRLVGAPAVDRPRHRAATAARAVRRRSGR